MVSSPPKTSNTYLDEVTSPVRCGSRVGGSLPSNFNTPPSIGLPEGTVLAGGTFSPLLLLIRLRFSRGHGHGGGRGYGSRRGRVRRTLSRRGRFRRRLGAAGGQKDRQKQRRQQQGNPSSCTSVQGCKSWKRGSANRPAAPSMVILRPYRRLRIYCKPRWSRRIPEPARLTSTAAYRVATTHP